MKLLFIILTFIMFTTSPLSANEKCTDIKKFSKEYLKCISGKIKDKTLNIELDTSNVKEKKYLTDWFKKKK